MTDDVCPRFWRVLEAMVAAAPDRVLGLLSNHPRGPELAMAGARWYRTNSWVVGPAYVVPHAHMVALSAWEEVRYARGESANTESHTMVLFSIRECVDSRWKDAIEECPADCDCLTPLTG